MRCRRATLGFQGKDWKAGERIRKSRLYKVRGGPNASNAIQTIDVFDS